MKKRISAILAATAILGVTTAFAATNPFADVPTSSWAYQAVTQLADQGIVIGYPSEHGQVYFKGNQNITRYEMAQIIARLLTKKETMDAQKQAVIGKLAQEYANELRQLGVRMMEVNKKAGNVVKIGDARVRFLQTPVVEILGDVDLSGTSPDDVKKALFPLVKQVGPDVGTRMLKDLMGAEKVIAMGMAPGATPEAQMGAKKAMAQIGALKKLKNFSRKTVNSKYDLRFRLNFIGLNNPNTKVIGRLVMSTEFGQGSKNNVAFDRFFVWHKAGNLDLVIGRQEVKVGDGLVYDDAFDGVLASYHMGDTRISAAYGYPNHFTAFNGGTEDPLSMGYVLDGRAKTLGASLLQVQTKVAGTTDIKAFYLWGNENVPVNAYGLALATKVNHFMLGAEYVKLLKSDKLPQPYGYLASLVDDNYAWTAYLGYGNYDLHKAGTWAVKLRYLWEGRVSPTMNNYALGQPFLTNYNGWNVTADFAIAKNLTINGSAFLNGKNKVGNENYDNTYSLSVNYSF